MDAAFQQAAQNRQGHRAFRANQCTEQNVKAVLGGARQTPAATSAPHRYLRGENEPAAHTPSNRTDVSSKKRNSGRAASESSAL